MYYDKSIMLFLADQLGSTMSFAKEEGEYYFTTPIADGAIEIHNGGEVFFRRWSLDHGLTHEELIETLPIEVSLYELPSYIRIMLRHQEFNRALNCGADEPLIYRACALAQLNQTEISHGTAKAIAASYDQYYSSGTNEFAATGAIVSENLWYLLFGSYYEMMSSDDKLAADMLGTYLVQRRIKEQTGAVPGWSKMSVDKPESKGK